MQWAILVFSPEASRWVKNQCWHSDQKGRILEDESYELSIPYSNDTELLMDILRYGAKVEIISPISLREKLSREIDSMKELYSQSLK